MLRFGKLYTQYIMAQSDVCDKAELDSILYDNLSWNCPFYVPVMVGVLLRGLSLSKRAYKSQPSRNAAR